MRIRLAALIFACSAAYLSFRTPAQPKSEHAAAHTICTQGSANRERVIEACTRLLRAQDVSTDRQAHLLSQRALAYRGAKQYEAAVAGYDSVLTLRPNDVPALVQRAKTHAAAGDAELAGADFDRALEIEPDSVLAVFEKAKFDRAQDRMPEAMQGFERALALDPSYATAAIALVNARYSIDGHDGMVEFFKQAEMRWPDQEWVYFDQILYALQHSGDHESALQAASGFGRLKRNQGGERVMSALIHLKIGDEAKGVALVETIAALNLERSYSKQSFVKRWYNKTADKIMVGQSREGLSRGFWFAYFGRTDLATSEIKEFLQETGTYGRNALLRNIRQVGVAVPRQAYAGSSKHLEIAVNDYVNHINAELGFGGIPMLKKNADR